MDGEVENVMGDIGPFWHEELSAARKSHFSTLSIFNSSPRNPGRYMSRGSFSCASGAGLQESRRLLYVNLR